MHWITSAVLLGANLRYQSTIFSEKYSHEALYNYVSVNSSSNHECNNWNSDKINQSIDQKVDGSQFYYCNSSNFYSTVDYTAIVDVDSWELQLRGDVFITYLNSYSTLVIGSNCYIAEDNVVMSECFQIRLAKSQTISLDLTLLEPMVARDYTQDAKQICQNFRSRLNQLVKFMLLSGAETAMLQQYWSSYCSLDAVWIEFLPLTIESYQGRNHLNSLCGVSFVHHLGKFNRIQERSTLIQPTVCIEDVLAMLLPKAVDRNKTISNRSESLPEKDISGEISLVFVSSMGMTENSSPLFQLNANGLSSQRRRESALEMIAVMMAFANIGTDPEVPANMRATLKVASLFSHHHSSPDTSTGLHPAPGHVAASSFRRQNEITYSILHNALATTSFHIWRTKNFANVPKHLATAIVTEKSESHVLIYIPEEDLPEARAISLSWSRVLHCGLVLYGQYRSVITVIPAAMNMNTSNDNNHPSLRLSYLSAIHYIHNTFIWAQDVAVVLVGIEAVRNFDPISELIATLGCLTQNTNVSSILPAPLLFANLVDKRASREFAGLGLLVAAVMEELLDLPAAKQADDEQLGEIWVHMIANMQLSFPKRLISVDRDCTYFCFRQVWPDVSNTIKGMQLSIQDIVNPFLISVEQSNDLNYLLQPMDETIFPIHNLARTKMMTMLIGVQTIFEYILDSGMVHDEHLIKNEIDYQNVLDDMTGRIGYSNYPPEEIVAGLLILSYYPIHDEFIPTILGYITQNTHHIVTLPHLVLPSVFELIVRASQILLESIDIHGKHCRNEVYGAYNPDRCHIVKQIAQLTSAAIYKEYGPTNIAYRIMAESLRPVSYATVTNDRKQWHQQKEAIKSKSIEQIHFVTVATSDSTELQHLLFSATLSGVIIEVIGMGLPNLSHLGEKLLHYALYLSSELLEDDDVVVLLDAYDVILFPSIRRIPKFLGESACPVVACSDNANFPYPLGGWFTPHSSDRNDNEYVQFFNSGCIAGRVGQLREIFARISNPMYVHAIKDDQQQLVFDMLEHPHLYCLDASKSMFVTGFKQLTLDTDDMLSLHGNLSFSMGFQARNVGLAHFNAKFRSDSYSRTVDLLYDYERKYLLGDDGNALRRAILAYYDNQLVRALDILLHTSEIRRNSTITDDEYSSLDHVVSVFKKMLAHEHESLSLDDAQTAEQWIKCDFNSELALIDTLKNRIDIRSVSMTSKNELSAILVTDVMTELCHKLVI